MELVGGPPYDISPETDISSLLPKDSIERLLSTALSRGGDFADVYIQRSRSMDIPLEEKKIRSAQIRIYQGVGIRVTSGEKTGFAYSDTFDMHSLVEAARVAAQIAEGPGTEKPIRITPEPTPQYYTIKIDPDSKPIAEKTALLKRASKAAYAYDHRIKQVEVSYSDVDTEIVVANSEGLWVSDNQPMLRFFVFCLAREGKVTRSSSLGGGGRIGMEYFQGVSPEDIAQEAARVAIIQLEAGPAPAGMMPVVIHRGWGGVLLHEAVGHGLEADLVRKGVSTYAGRLGEQVSSPLCTLVDDATIPNRRGSINIDDEGTPGQRTVLIEKGVLKAYMTDHLNGRLMGLPLTGNGRRQSYQYIPLPRMTNFLMEAGDSDPEEIINSVERGVFAKNFSGGQVDTTSGNFVFTITEGYMIEKGKITRPIRGATLIGNGPEILNKLEMVGSDLALDPGIGTCGKNGQGVPTGVGMPTVKISELTVGGTEE
ncbi:MAG: metalloprotease TldD [Armatimonadetes bacterium]|nr:metalloprotease TldD [Armatimonadota bacterium]